MKTIEVTELSMSTVDHCSLYLVGGFDSEMNHLPALPIFRPGRKEALYDICARAEAGIYDDRKAVEDLIIHLLYDAVTMTHDGTRYIFNIKSFNSQAALEELVYEVLAQVNEE